MNIVDNASRNTALGQTGRAAETQATGNAAKGSGAKSSSAQADGLQLSKFAGTLSQVIQSDSTARSARVEQLTSAVQSGNYRVDSAAVSRSLVDHAISSSQSLQ
jgi:flagellar biosynthesis anti-sigma factor FlgM